MIFLPSLLEYSNTDLNTKLQKVSTNIVDFKALQDRFNSKPAPKLIYLHLDSVLPNFAKERNVEACLSISDISNCIKQIFSQQNLNLSVHLMGDLQDLNSAYNEFNQINFPENWDITIFVPEFAYLYFQKLGFKTGIWLDLDQWYNQDIDLTKFSCQLFLLMTVHAGKSGQKLTEFVRSSVINLISKYPELSFIVDGGWSVEDNVELDNLDAVSYSSFWKSFDLISKNTHISTNF